MNVSSKQESALTVHIGNDLLIRIVGQANRDLPIETCGMLLGYRDRTIATVTAFAPCRNVAPDRLVAYEIDPDAILKQIRADSAEPESNKRLIGFYHSHPTGSANLSPHDISAAWPDMLQLIVSPSTNRTGLTQNRFKFFWHNGDSVYAMDVVPTANPCLH